MKIFLVSLLALISTGASSFASDSKVICSKVDVIVNIDTNNDASLTSKHKPEDILNQAVSQAKAEGYTIVSAPALTTVAGSKNFLSEDHSIIVSCVTVTKP